MSTFTNQAKNTATFSNEFIGSPVFWDDSVATWDGLRYTSALTSSFSTYPTVSDRNNFGGCVGFTFKVSESIVVTQLGRFYYTGNVQNHTIKLWSSADTVTPLATTTILADSASDSNGFKWANVSSVTLIPGVTYAIAADENISGDLWKDLHTPNLNSIFTNIAGAYNGTKGLYPNQAGSAGQIYNTCALYFSTSSQYSIGDEDWELLVSVSNSSKNSSSVTNLNKS